MTTRDDLITALAALTQHLDHRVNVWRLVIASDGRVVGRIWRGSFTPTSEHSQGAKQ